MPFFLLAARIPGDWPLLLKYSLQSTVDWLSFCKVLEGTVWCNIAKNLSIQGSNFQPLFSEELSWSVNSIHQPSVVGFEIEKKMVF